MGLASPTLQEGLGDAGGEELVQVLRESVALGEGLSRGSLAPEALERGGRPLRPLPASSRP
ncbi:MAG: hypothetical protein ACO2OU_00905 [Thermus aquaticus]|uniref:hypothetical protein n=1 Tax=Thermus aquaticus TaxID=271 RepID=UPI003C0FF359